MAKEYTPAVRVKMSGRVFNLDEVMKYISREKMHHAGKYIAEVTGINKDYANKLAFAVRDTWQAGYDPIQLTCAMVGKTKMTAKFTIRMDDDAIKEHAEEEKAREEEAKREAMPDEEKLLLRLKKANEAIVDKDVTEMLDKIEDIVTKIIARIIQKPEARTLIEEFYVNYLPKAVKIAEKYATICQTGIDNEDTASLKADMLKSLRTCDDAFHKLFENTYDEDMIKLSSEMAALNNTLSYEGLTRSDFDISE